MSNALALAAVSAVLIDLLNNGIIDHEVTTLVGAPVTVTALPPDRITVGDDEQPQLNLFLYQVTPNSGWQNSAFPSRDGQGNRQTNPPLALDLHYMLTAYGTTDFQGEILLGYAMQLLHENPFLPRTAIRTALGTGQGGIPVTSGILPVSALAASDLAEQVELIKIAPLVLNIEELSKLWTAFQANYRPTAAYHVSVVLIESTKSIKSARPVSTRGIFVQPFRYPTISAVTPQIVAPGAALTLTGTNLKANITKVNFGTTLIDPTQLNDLSLQVVPPPGLLPGVNTVQIVEPLDFGTTQEPHAGFESNVAAFMLAPVITTANPMVAVGGVLTLNINPPVGRTQQVSLLLGDTSVPIAARPASGPLTTSTLDFPIPPDLPPQVYPLRVMVDGAQSPLNIDTNPLSPTFNQYTGGPTVTVTP